MTLGQPVRRGKAAPREPCGKARRDGLGPRKPGDVNRPLSEAAAWTLLLALRAGRSEGPAPGALCLDADGTARRCDPGDADLLIDAAGSWSAPRPPEPAAATLLDLHLGFALASPRRPMTLAHLGQSLDGMIATQGGASHYVTGPENIRHLHRLRALADAVLVGAGTVAADDPRLTVREVEGPDPLRVVIDPRGRLPAERRVFADGAAPALLVLAEGMAAPAAVESLALAGGDEGIAPCDLVAALRRRGCAALLVEGGGETVTRFLRDGALERLQIAVAPLLIGKGRRGVALPAATDLSKAFRPPCHTFSMGCDVLFDFDLSVE